MLLKAIFVSALLCALAFTTKGTAYLYIFNLTDLIPS
jgi:hypothetical protein